MTGDQEVADSISARSATLLVKIDHESLFLFYKMQNGLAPDYLVDLVPPRVGNETPTAFVMLIIINRFMQILDCILTHFFLLRFESGTIFPLM